MTVLIPMAGAGRRFVDAGYKTPKPMILTTSLKIGKKIPMVVAAILDLPIDIKKEKIILIDRQYKDTKDVQNEIKKYIPQATFITIDYLTDGQASTCLLAKSLINNDDPLFIASCDNGMVLDVVNFQYLSKHSDAVVFTHRNHALVLEKPDAYGWVKTQENSAKAIDISVKVPISDSPLRDHAIVGSFWFNKGSDFVKYAESMIKRNDRINNEFYVDLVLKYFIDDKKLVSCMELIKYLGWGTPLDYENYEKTISYWTNFLTQEGAL